MCDRGYPTKFCAYDHEFKCEACHSTGDTVDENNLCVANLCTCEHGTETVNHNCEDNGSEDCVSCASFYHQETRPSVTSRWYGSSSHYFSIKEVCVPNVCTCENGTPVGDGQCAVHDEEKCASCNAGYRLSGSLCVINVCICDNGLGAIGSTNSSTCQSHGSHICDSCDSGFQLRVGNTNTTCILSFKDYIDDGWFSIPEWWMDNILADETTHHSVYGYLENDENPICPPNEELRGSHVIYKPFVSQGISWFEARDACNALGDGITLARVYCAVEDHFITRAVVNQYIDKRTWIGGNDLNNEGTFVWADDTDSNNGPRIEEDGIFQHFGGGGYRHYWSGARNNEHNCLMQGNKEGGSKWQISACDWWKSGGYVCEKRFFVDIPAAQIAEVNHHRSAAGNNTA